MLCSISFGAQSDFKIGTVQFLGGLAGDVCCLAPAVGLFELTYDDS